MAKRFESAYPLLKNILSKYDGDVKEASKELVYEKGREKLIGITDARKLLSCVSKYKAIEDNGSLESEYREVKILLSDMNSILDRSEVDLAL